MQEQVIVQAIPRVVGSLPPVEVFTGPVAQVHQELLSAGEMMVDIAEIPVVPQQVIVQDIPDVIAPLPPAQEFSAPVYGQVHQVFVGLRPERLVDARGPQRCGRTVPSVGAPVLAVQSLRGFDGVDNTAAKFLLQQALKKKEEKARKVEMEQVLVVKEQWRARRKVLKDEFMALMALPSLTPLQASRTQELVEAMAAHDASKPYSGSSKRKKKKRKRRKLPKASSSSFWCSSWARSLCPCCATTELWSDSAESRAGSAVAVHRSSSASLRAAEANLHGPACSIPYRHRSCSRSGGRCPRAMPVVVPTGAHGSGTAKNCGGASSHASVFIALLVSQWIHVLRQLRKRFDVIPTAPCI